MNGRCGPLCQHPGCWRAGNKEPSCEAKHSRFTEYLDYITLKKRSEKQPDTSVRSHSTTPNYDDSPVLTIFDIEANILPISKPQSQPILPNVSNKQLTSLNPSWSNSNTTTTYSGPFNFAQFFLEEEDEGDHLRKLQDLQALSDYNFAPVLLWKPSSASKQRKLKQKQATSEGDSNAGERKLKKMNLIDNLPINKQETTTFKQPEVKRAKTNTQVYSDRQTSGLTLHQYIVDGLSDVPPHIVKQIIQHLSSQKHFMEDATNKKPKQQHSPSHTTSLPFSFYPTQDTNNAHIPSSLVLDLSSQKLYQTSVTKQLTGPTQDTSYSRSLACRPVETVNNLKSKSAKSQQKPNENPTGNKPHLFSSSKQTWSQLTSFPNIQNFASGLSSYLATRPLTKPSSNDTNLSSLPLTAPVSAMPSRTQRSSPIRLPQVRTFSEDVTSRSTTATTRQTTSGTLDGKEITPLRRNSSCNNKTFSRQNSGKDTTTRSSTTLSNVSSEHNIIRADLLSQTGEIILINRDGEIIHEIPRTATDISLPLEAVIQVTNEEDEYSGVVQIEDGAIAPPPSARDWKENSPGVSFESVVNQRIEEEETN